jgi:hypothetical protein
VVGKVRIKFKISVLENACLVARSRRLMTDGNFVEGYTLIKDMQESEFLTALRMLAEREPFGRPIVQYDDRRQPSARALSRRWPRDGRSYRRAGPGRVCHYNRVDRIYPRRPAAAAGRMHGQAFRSAAGHSHGWRICSGIRSKLVVRRRRAEGDARRSY